MFSGAAIIGGMGGGGGVTFRRAVTRGTRYYQNSTVGLSTAFYRLGLSAASTD